MNRTNDPIFIEIAQGLIAMLESNFHRGEYIGHDFKSPVTQEIRDARAAIGILEIIGENSKNAVTILTKLLEKETHWWLPGASAKALGAMGSDAESAIPLLASLMLSDGNEPKSDWGHYDAATAMGNIGSIKAVPYLIQAFKDSDEQGPCSRAISSLGKLGEKAHSATPVLIQLLHNDNYSDYQTEIVHALGQIWPLHGS